MQLIAGMLATTEPDDVLIAANVGPHGAMSAIEDLDTMAGSGWRLIVGLATATDAAVSRARASDAPAYPPPPVPPLPPSGPPGVC